MNLRQKVVEMSRLSQNAPFTPRQVRIKQRMRREGSHNDRNEIIMNRHMILRGISLEVPGRRWEGCFFEALLKNEPATRQNIKSA